MKSVTFVHLEMVQDLEYSPWYLYYMYIILFDYFIMGAHVRRNLRYMICLWHMIRSRAVTYVLSYHLKQVPW